MEGIQTTSLVEQTISPSVKILNITVSPEGWNAFISDINVYVEYESSEDISDSFWKIKFIGDISYFRKELQSLVIETTPILKGRSNFTFTLPGLDVSKVDLRVITSACMLLIKACSKSGVKRKMEEEEPKSVESDKEKVFDPNAPLSETINDEGETIHGHVSLVVSLRITDGVHYRNIFTCF